MNVIGEVVELVKTADPSTQGRKGKVVLETAKTLRLDAGGRQLTIEKKGTVMLVHRSRRVVPGDEIAGRLEDRLRSKKR